MKKYLFLAVLSLTFLTGGQLVHADTANDSNFVPLTNIPAITEISNLSSLDGFFNNLYLICIGIAATLAVLQIMRAGIMWMSAGDNSENISKARNLIGSSIFGLVLILSPYIVFSIINPRIVQMNLDFSNIAPHVDTPSSAANTSAPATNTPAIIPATGQVNPACQAMNITDGSVINRDKEDCCSEKTSATTDCNPQWDPYYTQETCQCVPK